MAQQTIRTGSSPAAGSQTSAKKQGAAQPPHPLLASIMQDALAPVFWHAERVGHTSAWWSHVPFAHWLIAACRPKLFVELGTHAGVSYTAFCEAVNNTQCGARCYAIDTWQGDAHAGAYGEEIYGELKGFNDARYNGFSELIKAKFDDALEYFAEKSIDLLHIDGLHTYEAVKHDFESWLPKLSDKAVVILHDTNVKRDDFGVYKLQRELSEQYPSFEFSHGFGLGVIAVGARAPQAVLDLCAIETPEHLALVRDRFSFLGNRWLTAAREALVVNDLHHRLGLLQAEQKRTDDLRQLDGAEITRLHGELEGKAQLSEDLAHARNSLQQAENRQAEALHTLSQAHAITADLHLHSRAFLKNLQKIASGEDTENLRETLPKGNMGETIEGDLLASLKIIGENLQMTSDHYFTDLHKTVESMRSTIADQAAAASQLAEQRALEMEEMQTHLNHVNEQLKARLDLANEELETRLGHANDELEARLKQANIAVSQAEGERNAAERMRQNTVARVGELRRALDAVGQEASTAREMSRGLARRYSAALDQWNRAKRRDPANTIKRLRNGLKKSKRSPVRADDLFLLENSIYFDANWYIEKYADVKAEGLNPALHFLLHGAAEYRDPGPWFSTRQYMVNNPDVAAAGANALLHYLRHGEQEGRTPNVAPPLDLPRDQPAAVRHNHQLSCVFITGEPESAGHRYRVLDFIDAAKANNVAAKWVRADDLAGRHDELAKHDIAIFWRVAWTDDVGAAISYLQYRGRKVVFDVDDLMTEPALARHNLIDGIRTQSLTEDGVRAHYERVRRTMLAADACLATTEELALYMRGAGKTTYVVSNGFTRAIHDLSRMAVRKHREAASDNLIRIGYAGGSRTHQRDFSVCVAGVAQLLREKSNCRLVLFRTPQGPLTDPAEFPELADLETQIEWRNAVPLAELPLEMARFDINLAPLEFGNPYCEAKSELKFFEAALVDVPTIASPTGPFRRAIDHGKTGFLAASADDWLVYLRRLVDDRPLSINMGKAAYRSALARFGPETKALRFGNVLEQLRGGPGAARAFALDTHLVRRRPPAPGVYPSEIFFKHDKLCSAEVTVVVPLYNYEDFVEETLDSVLAQTAPMLDLVIVDGHSTDRSLAVACRWAERHADRFNRLIVLQNSANYGLGFCRNSGFDVAETPYIVLLDADNKLAPAACTELATHAQRTGAAFVYPTIQHFGASTALMGNAPFDAQKLAAGNYIDAMALVSKEAWAMAGGVDHVRHGWEDYDFWCRIAELGLRGEWLDRPLGLYRVHATSMQTVQTKVPDNHRRLLENFESRHPWTWLNGRENVRQLPSPQTKLLRDEERTRLDRLLPILRCPFTHQKLGFNADRSALHSFDGFRVWPIMNGRPVFTSVPSAANGNSEGHHTNILPDIALDLIRATQGWVLNLSAGETEEKFDHVVKAEHVPFRHTDVVTDAHELPFDDNTFEAAIILNGFEHYHDLEQAAAELHRVLQPGGKLLIVTSSMNVLNKRSGGFYKFDRYSFDKFLKSFEIEHFEVPNYLSPNFTMGWIASELEVALRNEIGEASAQDFLQTNMQSVVSAFRDPSERQVEYWENVQRLPQSAQEISGAGFEIIGKKGDGIPVYVK